MSELSDLSELLTGAIAAQASVTRVVHADQLDEIRAALNSSPAPRGSPERRVEAKTTWRWEQAGANPSLRAEIPD